LQLADSVIDVVAESKEWDAAVDSDEDDAPGSKEKYASQLSRNREKRLTVGMEQLEKAAILADTEVNVVAETNEWAGVVESDDEDDGPQKLEVRATEAYQRRESRLTVSAEQLQKELIVADQEVDLVIESKEWVDADNSDEENGGTNLEQTASEAHQAREKRITLGSQQLEKALILADAEVGVVTESKEWKDEVDTDEDDLPGNIWQEKRASRQFQAREKRLSVGAETLRKSLHNVVEVGQVQRRISQIQESPKTGP